jgi:hypothetical protein
MPCWISNAVDKLNHNNLRLRLSALLRLRLSRSCGIACDWTMALLISATAVMLVVLGLTLIGIILAVLIR